MSNQKKIEKYEDALRIILLLVENNKNIKLTRLIKIYKLNKNISQALQELEIIKNSGNRGASNYILLKKYNKQLAIDVLNKSNEISLRKRQTIIENDFEPARDLKEPFLKRFFSFKF